MRNIKQRENIDYIASKFVQFKDSFDLGTFTCLCFKKFLYFFFVYHPLQVIGHVAPYVYFAYSLSGLSLLLYILIKAKGDHDHDKLLYIYIISFSIPYCLAGATYRYSFPIVPFAAMLAAYSMYTIWHWVKRGTINHKFMTI